MSKAFAKSGWNLTRRDTPNTQGEGGDCRGQWKGAKIVSCASRVPHNRPMLQPSVTFVEGYFPPPIVFGDWDDFEPPQLGAAIKAEKPRARRKAVHAKAKANPDDPRLDYNRGLTLVQERQLGAALDAFDRAISLKPDFAYAHCARAATLTMLGRLDEALEAFETTIRIDPNSARAHGGRGWVLAMQGKINEAFPAINHAAGLDPNFPQTYLTLGLILVNLDYRAEALTALNHTISLDPQNAVAYHYKGLTLEKSGQFAEAFEAYSEAVKFNPDDAHFHQGRGRALNSLGRSGEALESFERSIALDSENAFSHYYRGSILNETGRLAEALDAYNQAIELSSDNLFKLTLKQTIAGVKEKMAEAAEAEPITPVENSGDVLPVEDAPELIHEDRQRDEEINSDLTGDKAKIIVPEAIKELLKELGVPEYLYEEFFLEIKRMVTLKLGKSVSRPKWDERGKYADLKDLSAPLFLKHVYADIIGLDGTIEKEVVRQSDRVLMATVDAYIGKREKRSQDAGDARGLQFVARSTRPKTPSLG